MKNSKSQVIDFIDGNACAINPSLANAIIEKIGNVESFNENTLDIISNGIDSQFYDRIKTDNQWVIQLFQDNKKNLEMIIERDAEESGYKSINEYIREEVGSDFYSLDEVSAALHKKPTDDNEVLRLAIADVFVWQGVGRLCCNWQDYKRTA